MLEKIVSLSNQSFEVKDVLQECNDKYEDAIDYINQSDYQSGDVALEIRIRTKLDPDVLGVETKSTIYYADNKSNHKAYADKFSYSSISVLSVDETAIDMQFCRGVTMPSLVLTLDALGEDDDKVMKEFNPSPEEQRLHPADGIWNGLENWVKVLSPIGFWAAY